MQAQSSQPAQQPKQKNTASSSKRAGLAATLLLLAAAACLGGEQPIPTPVTIVKVTDAPPMAPTDTPLPPLQPYDTPQPAPTTTPLPTLNPARRPTETPYPTSTPYPIGLEDPPTATPYPTATPWPTATYVPTPPFQPTRQATPTPAKAPTATPEPYKTVLIDSAYQIKVPQDWGSPTIVDDTPYILSTLQERWEVKAPDGYAYIWLQKHGVPEHHTTKQFSDLVNDNIVRAYGGTAAGEYKGSLTNKNWPKAPGALHYSYRNNASDHQKIRCLAQRAQRFWIDQTDLQEPVGWILILQTCINEPHYWLQARESLATFRRIKR